MHLVSAYMSANADGALVRPSVGIMPLSVPQGWQVSPQSTGSLRIVEGLHLGAVLISHGQAKAIHRATGQTRTDDRPVAMRAALPTELQRHMCGGEESKKNPAAIRKGGEENGFSSYLFYLKIICLSSTFRGSQNFLKFFYGCVFCFTGQTDSLSPNASVSLFP